MSRPRFATRTLFAGLCCASLAGCAYQDFERDIDRNPVVNTGAGASIISPGPAGRNRCVRRASGPG